MVLTPHTRSSGSCLFPITPLDLEKIENSEDLMGAAMIICNIIRQMPKPRILVLEPTVTGNRKYDHQWLLAFDLAIVALADQNEGSVIDSSWLRILAECNPELARKFNKKRVRYGEEIFSMLITRHFIEMVYLPNQDEDLMNSYHRHIIKQADEQSHSFPYQRPFDLGFYTLITDDERPS